MHYLQSILRDCSDEAMTLFPLLMSGTVHLESLTPDEAAELEKEVALIESELPVSGTLDAILKEIEDVCVAVVESDGYLECC